MDAHKQPTSGREPFIILQFAICNLWSKFNIEVPIGISRLTNTKEPKAEQLDLDSVGDRQCDIFLVRSAGTIEPRSPGSIPP